jgi:hypothetical protein
MGSKTTRILLYQTKHWDMQEMLVTFLNQEARERLETTSRQIHNANLRRLRNVNGNALSLIGKNESKDEVEWSKV